MRQRLGKWWSGLSTRGRVLAAVAVLIVLGAIGSSSRSPSRDVAATPTARPTTAAGPTTTAEQPAPTVAPAASVGPRPTVEPPPINVFDTIELQGRGDKIARFVIPEDVGAFAEITYDGTANFAVWTVNASGEETDLLVNEIGAYTGLRLIAFDGDEHAVAFKVESSGRWTITVKPLWEAPYWDRPGNVSGKGDFVLSVNGVIEGFAISTITHNGDSNFAVWAYGEAVRDLLVNEIGSYTGEVLWPSGTSLLEITADGKWTISAPE